MLNISIKRAPGMILQDVEIIVDSDDAEEAIQAIKNIYKELSKTNQE